MPCLPSLHPQPQESRHVWSWIARSKRGWGAVAGRQGLQRRRPRDAAAAAPGAGPPRVPYRAERTRAPAAEPMRHPRSVRARPHPAHEPAAGCPPNEPEPEAASGQMRSRTIAVRTKLLRPDEQEPFSSAARKHVGTARGSASSGFALLRSALRSGVSIRRGIFRQPGTSVIATAAWPARAGGVRADRAVRGSVTSLGFEPDPSSGAPAAIGDDRRAGDVAGVVGRKKHGDTRDLPGIGEIAERRFQEHPLAQVGC
jgi:hypothetical protein